MWVLWLGTLAGAGWCAARLAGRMSAVLAIGLLALHSTFVERGIEVRPDPLLAFFTVLALACELGSWTR